MYKSVLVPLDGSALSESVLPHVVQLVEGTSVRVTLLAVKESAERIVSSPHIERERLIDAAGQLQQVTLQETHVQRTAETVGQALQRAEDELGIYLEERARNLRDKGISIDCAVRFGDPAEEIASYASERAIDLIAMASHGRSGLARLVLGSVTGRVIQLAGRPVLVARPAGLA